MRPYEIMVILDAGLDEEVIRTTIDRATKVIADGGGQLGKVDRWGRRRFAYEVNHRNEGYYVLIETTAAPDAVAELSRVLALADEVIRHKVIRVPDKVAGRHARPAATDPAPTAASHANGA
ncbi:MAG: 30S ribosomal protein S6 [Acidimicrobiales bacterium]